MTPAERSMLWKIWQRAFKEGEVVLELPTEKDLHLVRMALYNAPRHSKTPEEVKEAREQCSVSVRGPKTLAVLRGDQKAFAGMLAKAAGMDVEVPKSAVDLSAQAFLAKLAAEREAKPTGQLETKVEERLRWLTGGEG